MPWRARTPKSAGVRASDTAREERDGARRSAGPAGLAQLAGPVRSREKKLFLTKSRRTK